MPRPLAIPRLTISQLPNKFCGQFATPVEYVMLSIHWSHGCLHLLNHICLTLTTLYCLTIYHTY